MRISYLYDLELPSRTGAAIQILGTCRAVCEHGAAADVWVRAIDGAPDAVLHHYGLDPHPALRLRTFPQARGEPDMAALGTHLRSGEADGLHVVMSRGESGLAFLPPLASGARPSSERLVYEAHRLCFPYVLEERDPPPRGIARAAAWLRSRRIRRREARTLRVCDGVAYLTPGVRDAVQAEFGTAPPHLILPSGTAPPDRAVPSEAERDVDVVYAGKLERRKGVDLLLAAMRHLPGRRAEVIGGSDQQARSLRSRAVAEGVADRVHLTGHLAPPEVAARLRRGRVGVCPLPLGVSRIADRFTSPLKIVQMMALGVPIVATDTPSVREILTHGRTALLCRPNDPRALADAIHRLLRDRALAAELARHARAEAASYSWNARAGRLLDFLAALR